jgi:hypothetical protein
VEIVRHAFEVFARGGIEPMIEYAAPDCVFYPDPSWMEDREYRGREAFIAFTKTQTDAFGDLGSRSTTFGRSAIGCWRSPNSSAKRTLLAWHSASRPLMCSPISTTTRSGRTGPFSVGTRRAKLWGSRTRRHGGEWLL